MKNLPVPEAHVQYGFQLRDVTHGKDGPVDVLRSDCVTICVHSGRHDTYRERERIEWSESCQGAESVPRRRTSKMRFTNNWLTNLRIFKLRAYYFEKLIGRWSGCYGWSGGAG